MNRISWKEIMLGTIAGLSILTSPAVGKLSSSMEASVVQTDNRGPNSLNRAQGALNSGPGSMKSGREEGDHTGRGGRDAMMFVKMIDGQIGEKTGVLTVEKIAARIGSWIDGKTDGKIDNSIDERVGEKIDGSRGVRIIASTQAGNFADWIEPTLWQVTVGVMGVRTPVSCKWIARTDRSEWSGQSGVADTKRYSAKSSMSQ